MPATIGRYELQSRLGAGAMGEVWRATDTSLARPVALKLLAPGRLQDAEARARFVRESRASSALNHPNIVTVFEAGQQEEQPFLAMELVLGRTVRDLLLDGPLPRAQAIEIARQALLGLAEAHAAGIIHRDVKPENLMVRGDGFVKILDFGLAAILDAGRLTQSDAVMGTPLYMSPEQALGKPLDGRTDLWSLGVVLFEMLTGRTPFNGDSFFAVIRSILDDPFPAGDVLPADLRPVLQQALEKDRERRYAGAAAMAAALVPDVAAPAPAPPAASLVVLPFAASDADRELADGITDEVITALEKMNSVRVISRNTAMRFRGRQGELRDVGNELNVRLALEGSLRRSGSRVRVTTSLVETASGFSLWGDRFEGHLHDVFDLQDELAGGIVRVLRERFGAAESFVPPAPVRVDTEARQLYQRALGMLGSMNPDGIQAAIEALGQSVRLDPDYAPAHARLAQALFHSCYVFQPADPAPLERRALEEAARALELDPRNADAFVAQAQHEIRAGRFVRARTRLREALRHAPNEVSALSWLALANIVLGDSAEGEVLARKAIARDPQCAIHYQWLVYALFAQGRQEEGREAAERALRLDDRNPFMWANVLMSDLLTGRLDDARAFVDFLQRHPVAHPHFRAVLLIYRALAAGVRWEDASERDRALVQSTLISARFAADVPALHGDAPQAVALLRVAAAQGDRNVEFQDRDRFLDPIRETDVFQAWRAELVALREEAIEAG